MLEDTINQETTFSKLLKLFEKRGKNALELARKKALEEKIESQEVNEALKYFMTEYWNDLARPTLLSLVCEAVGGDPNITTPIAIPLSLISGAIDIHDDIIDQTKSKWSRPTIFGKFGKDIALLVGDALLFKGFTLLYEAVEKGISSEKISKISVIIQKTFFELGEAESLELQFRGRINVTSNEYLRVVKKKAADVEAHTRISAILGNASTKETEALSTFGRFLGILIILRDDLTDMLDYEEFAHRIKKEHLPLQVIYALENTEDKSLINSILLKKRKTKKDLKTLRKTTYKLNGSIKVAEDMQNIAKDAVGCLEVTKYNKNDLKLLIEAMLPSNYWLKSNYAHQRPL